MLKLLPLLLFMCSASAQVSYFAAALDGANEVPPVVTPGGGFATVWLREPTNTVRIFVHYHSLPNTPTAAHLHLAPSGVNGPIIVPLTINASTGVFTAMTTLIAAEVAALKTAGTYINVHTAANPGGEIRGQVVEAVSTRFTAILDGAQEVPPNASTATGRADAYLHEPDNRLVYCIETTGLTNITAAHLHLGPTGVNGGVIFPLNGSGGNYCGVSPRLTASQVAALRADGTYFNVHTTSFPGGEIRGQAFNDPGSDYTTVLDGLQEVPPTTSSGIGAGSLHIDKDGDCHVTVSFTGLTAAPTAAHIHHAPVGVNGPISVPLALSGGQYVATFTPTSTQLAELRAGDWYVNVHTSTFPGGEIRGQLRAALLPSTFGPNCPGSNGERPEIGATGFAGLGATVDVELYGALPSAAAILSLGLDRDTLGNSPLPIAFAALGCPAPCFCLLDTITAAMAFAVDGCATRSLAVDFAPTLRGLPIYAQWVLLDAAANPAGLTASNGLTLTVQ